MPGIMPDNDSVGHFHRLLRHATSSAWRDVWNFLDLRVYTFAELALPANAPDRMVWRVCQEHDVILVTNNRNDDGPDSLTAALRDSNTADSPPVFTLANVERIRRNRQYAQRATERLLE